MANILKTTPTSPSHTHAVCVCVCKLWGPYRKNGKMTVNYHRMMHSRKTKNKTKYLMFFHNLLSHSTCRSDILFPVFYKSWNHKKMWKCDHKFSDQWLKLIGTCITNCWIFTVTVPLWYLAGPTVWSQVGMCKRLCVCASVITQQSTIEWWIFVILDM